MPTYTYVCPRCDTHETVIHSITSDSEVRCTFCSWLMDRKPQVNAVTFDGSGWGKDS